MDLTPRDMIAIRYRIITKMEEGGLGAVWKERVARKQIVELKDEFSMPDADTLLYRFEVDDATAFTRPWKGELTMVRAPGPIYEYACHEGNYALPNLLRGYRADEAKSKGR